MNWIHDTLSEFGEQLGIADLRLNAQGVVRLAWDTDALLTLELAQRREQQEVLVSIGRTVGHEAGQSARTALTGAHFTAFAPLDIQLAMAGGGAETLLIATTRLPARSFTPSQLSHAVRTLSHWLENVTTSGAAHA